jgi:hypothetical protein
MYSLITKLLSTLIEKLTDLTKSSFAQWVGALATSAAVVVALFKDGIVHWFKRPKLTARVQMSPPDCLRSPFRQPDSGKGVWQGNCYWIRLWIQNRGRIRAEQVQVFLSRVYEKERRADETIRFLPIPNFSPMNLRWSNNRDWNNPEIFAQGISTQPLGKHCDLCSICDPHNPYRRLEGYEGRCVASLQLEVFPPENREKLPPNEYRLEIILGAANARHVKKWLHLTLTGDWSPDLEEMFPKYVTVSIHDKEPNNLSD